MQRVRQARTGKQGGANHSIRVETLKSISELLNQFEFYEAGSRVGALCFDSMHIAEGIGYDINTDFVGIDIHTKFDVVTREFRNLAKAEVSCLAN